MQSAAPQPPRCLSLPTLLVAAFLLLPLAPAGAQSLFGIRISELFVSAMPVWTYNGFLEDGSGTVVQGSDISPITMSFGAGLELRLSQLFSVEPEAWFSTQEYAALNAYDKVVPTQIETGSAVGDIANAIIFGISIPAVFHWDPSWSGNWEFNGSAGLGLVFRIPISAIDGSELGPIARYWFAGRFIYPEFGVSADYQFASRIQVGAGLTWYVPFYNAWGRNVDVGFLDETMLRYGLRVRWLIGE